MNIDTQKIGMFFSANDLWDTPFCKFDRLDIERLCETICDAVKINKQGGGWGTPFIDNAGYLVIPYSAPLKYKYWQGGQSVLETLAELGASDETIKRYTATRSIKNSENQEV